MCSRTTIESGDELQEESHYLVGLMDGVCTGVQEVDSPEVVDYGFELSGPSGNRQEVVRGEMCAIEGIMGGDFELDGALNKLLEHLDPATTFAETCSENDTNIF